MIAVIWITVGLQSMRGIDLQVRSHVLNSGQAYVLNFAAGGAEFLTVEILKRECGLVVLSATQHVAQNADFAIQVERPVIIAARREYEVQTGFSVQQRNCSVHVIGAVAGVTISNVRFEIEAVKEVVFGISEPDIDIGLVIIFYQNLFPDRSRKRQAIEGGTVISQSEASAAEQAANAARKPEVGECAVLSTDQSAAAIRERHIG